MIYELQAHDLLVPTVVWNPAGTQFASAGWDAKVSIWDADSGRLLREYERTNAISDALVWSPLGDRIAFADADLSIWDSEMLNVLETWEATPDVVASLAWVPNATAIAVGVRNHIWFWSVNDKVLGGIDLRDAETLLADPTSITINPDATLLAVQVERQTMYGDLPDVVQIWDVRSREMVEVLENVDRTDTIYTNGIAWSHDGRFLMDASLPAQVTTAESLSGTP